MLICEPINNEISPPGRQSYPVWTGRFLGVIDAALTPLAGPYRALAYKPGSGEGPGLLAWSGVLIVFPAFAAISMPFGATLLDGFWWGWAFLVAAAFLRMMVRRSYRQSGREVEPSSSWAGPGEFLLAVALFIAGEFHCGPGVGSFLALGYAASRAQIHFGRARRRCEASMPGVTVPIVRPLRSWVARESESIGRYAARGRVAATSFARLMSRMFLAASSFSALGFALGASGLTIAWTLLKAYRRKRAEAATLPVATQSSTFTGRVWASMVASVIISVVSGMFGFNLRQVGHFLMILMGLVLSYFGGWDVKPPPDVRAKWERGVDSLEGQASSRVAELREEAEERLNHAKKEAAAKLKEAGAKAGDAAEAAGQRAGSSFRRGLIPW